MKKCLKYVIIYDVSISKPENARAGSNYFNLQNKNMKHKKEWQTNKIDMIDWKEKQNGGN